MKPPSATSFRALSLAMIERSFSLVPFPAADLPAVLLAGQVSLQKKLLEIQYSLAGDIPALLLPDPSANPGRTDELWKSTCFEFFLGPNDQPQYWEFNISPSGDWNVYHMDAYRRIGFREETSIQSLPQEIRQAPDLFHLKVGADLSPLLQQSEPIQLGIAAIIQTRDGNETYWALTHPAPYADFHLRESFILALAGRTQPLGQSAPGG